MTASKISAEERFRAMMEIANRAVQLPVFDPRSPDEIIGYSGAGYGPEPTQKIENNTDALPDHPRRSPS